MLNSMSGHFNSLLMNDLLIRLEEQSFFADIGEERTLRFVQDSLALSRHHDGNPGEALAGVDSAWAFATTAGIAARTCGRVSVAIAAPPTRSESTRTTPKCRHLGRPRSATGSSTRRRFGTCWASFPRSSHVISTPRTCGSCPAIACAPTRSSHTNRSRPCRAPGPPSTGPAVTGSRLCDVLAPSSLLISAHRIQASSRLRA